MPRYATKDAEIYNRMSKLDVVGQFETINDNPTTGTLYVDGDTNLIGVVSITGDLFVNGVLLSTVGTTSLNLPFGGRDGYVLTSDIGGNGSWKSPHWFTNDLPTEITNPTDNVIWTEQDIGIGITTPTERLVIGATTTGQGLLSGSAFLGTGADSVTDLMLAQIDNKNSTDYALLQESAGDTILNSSTNVLFNISDTEAARFDGSGNLGIGITNPSSLLHVNGDATIEGNLTVNGTLTTIDSNTVEIEDAALLLGRNNPADLIDGGIIVEYTESATSKYAGIFRDASATNKSFELFQSLEEKPTTTVNTIGTGYERASLNLDGVDIQSGITFSQANAEINHSGFSITGTDQHIFVNANGNIGVGVTTPSYDIDVVGDINADGVYRVNDSEVLNETTLGSGVVNSSLTNVGTLSSLTVSGDLTVDTETLYVDSSNNLVGIGTTNPTEKLTVLNNDDTNPIGVEIISDLSVLGNSDITQFINLIKQTGPLVTDRFGWKIISAGEFNSNSFFKIISTQGNVDKTFFQIFRNKGQVAIGDGIDNIKHDALLTINQASGTPDIPVLALRGGNNYIGYTNYGQIAFSDAASDDYRHFIHTRHSSLSNGIDFYVADGTTTANTIENATTHVMSLYNGNVGIGTIEPTSKLDVVGNANISGSGTMGSATITGDLTVDTNTLYVDSTNNEVGIGTLTPNYQLDVVGAGSIGALSLNANADSNLILKQSGTNSIIFNDSTDSTLMTLTNAGNLGIGVTNPTSQIHTSGNAEIGGNMVIQGDLTVNGTTTTIDTETVVIEDGMIKLANNNSADTIDTGVYSQYNDGTTKFSGYFRDASDGVIKFFSELEVEPTTTVDLGATGFNYSSLQAKDITLNEIKYTTDSTDLTFTNGGSTRAVLTPAGFYGVGTTAAYPLHVNKVNTSNWSGRFTNSLTDVFIANSDGNGMSINSGVDNTNTNLNLNVRNTTTNNVFVVRNDDKVGVLTSAPDRTFHVNVGTTGDGAKLGDAFVGNWAGNATTAVFTHDDLSQASGSYAIRQSASGQTDINAASGQEVRMNIDNSQIMTITSGGNVGIGITNPTDKLEVVGNIGITGNTSILGGNDLAIESGYLGIGDLTPAYAIDINVDENRPQIRILNTHSAGPRMDFASTNGTFAIQYSPGDSDNTFFYSTEGNFVFAPNNSVGVLTLSDTYVKNDVLLYNLGDVRIGTTAVPDNELSVDGTIDATQILVGTTTATEALHVVGDGKVTGDFTIGGNLIFDGVGVDGLTIQDSLIKFANNNQADLVDSGFYSLYNDGVSKYTGLFRDATDGVYSLFHELEIEPTTTVNTGATGYALADLNVSTLNADTEVIAPEFTATCDIRVKENIDIMKQEECYEKIKKLGLFSYNYDKKFNNSDERLYGLIAQNVEAHIPEAIKEKKIKYGSDMIDDFKTISQNTIIANLIGAVQHLTQKVEDLEKQLKK